MVLSPGTVVAGYRIERVLGSGGMGTVYLAANPVLPRRDALKVLSSELSRDPPFRARFIREADLAATLDHPNIVTVYTRGETEEGQLWIAMQYVAGSDAHKELDEGRMTVKRAVHITSEVAKALDYAHRRNLVHRDVKPGNFLLAVDDERVLLADFGIARALDDTAGLTATGTIMATVAYAAPELLGAGHIDGRADIYALGCSLYRMLTGEAPFASSGGIAAVMAAHLSQPPPRVTDRMDLPRGIDGVIAKAMAKNPDDRYQRARDFAEAAAAVLEEGVTTPLIRPMAPRQPQRAWPQPPITGQPPPATRGQPAETYPSGYFSGPVAGPGERSPGQPHNAPPPFHTPQRLDTARSAGQPGARPRQGRRRAWIAAAVGAVVLVAAATITTITWGGSSTHGYQAQSFDHLHGTTRIDAEPHAVAAVGAGDGDAVLSLGVQPVAMTAPGGRLASWEQQLATGNPKVLANLDTAAIAAAKPDVIIATGTIDDATYNSLSAIAPTVTRWSDQATPWTWQNQLTWIGRILGRDTKAKELIDTARRQQGDIRDQHPAFNGKTIGVLNVSDNGVTATLSGTFVADYLDGLGFRYSDDLRSGPNPAGERPVTTAVDFYQIEKADVLVVVRTDKAAGGGGYNGLPQDLTIYRGAMVIADDPNVIAALNTGGYAGNEYLNSNFVGALAQQVH